MVFVQYGTNQMSVQYSYIIVQYKKNERKMPRKGWSSITVPDEVYNYFFEEWKKHKEEYRLKYGITSFAGFTTKLLSEMLDQWEARRKAEKSQRSR